jgi:hypothetical protein
MRCGLSLLSGPAKLSFWRLHTDYSSAMAWRLLTLLAPALLVACSSFGDDGAPVVDECHLRVMVLPLADFGPEYAASTPDPDSGEQRAAAIVEASADPADEAEDVSRFGPVLRYVAAYSSNEAIVRGRGAAYLASSVTLYEDARGAAGDLADQFLDLQRNVSGTTRLGSLQSFERFEVGLAERAYGVSARLLTPGSTFGLRSSVTLTITAVVLQRGPLVGQVLLMRFDADDVRAEVTELGRRLDRRIVTVLGGGTPEPAEPSAPVASDASPPRSLP